MSKMNIFTVFICASALDIVLDVYGMQANELFHHSKKVVASFSGNDTVHVIDTVLDVSIQDCISACKDRTACTYINYMTRAHLCHLVTSPSLITPFVNVTPGFVYGRKLDWNMTDQCTGCGHEGQVCVNKSQPTGPCVTTGCGSPQVSNSDIIVRGNDFKIGSTVQQTCDIDPPEWRTMSCLENGTWSNSSITCDAGGLLCVSADSCYYVSAEPMSWFDAKTYCDTNYDYLVVLYGSYENNDVNGLLSTLNLPDYWFGATDIDNEGEWVWDATATTLTTTFNGFASAPDYDSSRNCLLVLGESFQWTDENCLTPHPFVCEQ